MSKKLGWISQCLMLAGEHVSCGSFGQPMCSDALLPGWQHASHLLVADHWSKWWWWWFGAPLVRKVLVGQYLISQRLDAEKSCCWRYSLGLLLTGVPFFGFLVQKKRWQKTAHKLHIWGGVGKYHSRRNTSKLAIKTDQREFEPLTFVNCLAVHVLDHQKTEAKIQNFPIPNSNFGLGFWALDLGIY